MAVCYIGCDDSLENLVKKYSAFQAQEIIEVEFPITASKLKIDFLIIGPRIKKLTHLAATISDWKIPPVTLMVLPEADYEAESENLRHHPRVGRSVFVSKDNDADILAGLGELDAFYTKRETLPLDHSVSSNYSINNISPRWLFHTLMDHLDEYIYFKDVDSRFLAVSRYLIESCGKSDPSEVIGHTDFEFFDTAHAKEAYSDERDIATGKLKELYKEEALEKKGKMTWVASRKLPLHTRSKYLAGSFGLSRDITEEKELHERLEENHERMQAELLLAKNLQRTLMQQYIQSFEDAQGRSALEVATKYIPSFHLSGDFFSVVQTPNGGAAILIADVMGHGVRAAMVTAMIQIAVQQLNAYTNQPAEFMTRLNQMIKRTMQPTGQTIFATAAYCYIDFETKQLTYVQAGARHGIYIPASSRADAAVFKQTQISPALGLIEDAEYSEDKLQLAQNDEIILYTDGIVEASAGNEEYSEERLIDFLKTHRREQLSDILDELLESAHDFTHSENLGDDVCLVGLRIN